ncbi:MAG: hypothetical protein H7257_05315 [Taibaiella sp.]|nr:hypothetical protein [Taibaiella sp.]
MIPQNVEGKENDLEHSTQLTTAADAMKHYMQARHRLLHPAEWHQLAGPLSAAFELVDNNGTTLQRPAAAGDYIRIDIPGPGTAAGGGYDWVRLEALEEKPGLCTALRLRPCPNPQTEEEGTAHFFREKATSTIIVERENNIITTSYHGRNELPNTKIAGTADKLRNAAIAAGAFAGLSELQWTALIKGLADGNSQ